MRFAILCRVSTEGQEKEGVSLEVQQKTLTECIKSLGGTCVKSYIGTESAMGIKERPIYEELLADCSKNLFDAIMVWDLSRWSRNPEKSRYGLAILKKNNIRLFIQSTEHNLNNPETDLIVGILNELNAFTVNQQTTKAMASKIELAKRGWPITNGPHGRRLVHKDKSKNAVYEVIPEYKEQAEKIYDLYVNQGLGVDRIANMMDIHKAQLRAILFEYSGNEWIQKIQYNGENLTFIAPVPPLLTDEQIEQARHKASSNKKFNSRKHNYLLGGLIKCGVCKTHYVGSGSGDSKKIRYYYHSKQFRAEICIKSIQVRTIETAVIEAISELFSSTTNLKLAIENAIGVSKDRKELLIRRIEELKKMLNKLDTEKDRLVQAVKKGLLDDADISKEMTQIKLDTLETRDQLKSYSDQLKTLMIEVPDDLHLRIQRYYKRLCNDEGYFITDWSYESQQRLINWFFGIGKDNGVFITRNNDGCIDYIVKGALASSLLGIINPYDGDRYFVATNSWNRSFQENEELVDFQRILRELDDLDENRCFEKQNTVIAHGAVADGADQGHGAGEIEQGGGYKTLGEVTGADPEALLQPVTQPVQTLFDIQQLAENPAQQQAADGREQALPVGQRHIQTDNHGRQPQTLHQGDLQAGRQTGTDGQADAAADDDGGGVDEGAEQGGPLS